LRGGAERGEGVAALIEQALEHREAGAPARLVDGPAAEVADRARLAGDRAVRVEGAEEAADAAVVLDQRADVGLVGEPRVLEHAPVARRAALAAEAAREERRDRVEVGDGGRTDAQRGAGRRR